MEHFVARHKRWLFLIFIFSLYGCKKSQSEPISSSSSSSCSIPISVDCGTWTSVNKNGELLIRNTPEITLPITNATECESHSGLIKIPSLFNNITLEFAVFINCTLANKGCVCSGNSYRPGNEVMIVSGLYELRLNCNDNNGSRQLLEYIDQC